MLFGIGFALGIIGYLVGSRTLRVAGIALVFIATGVIVSDVFSSRRVTRAGGGVVAILVRSAATQWRAVGIAASGLEGVIAFQTEIAEPDKAGGALRYRGVDIEDLVGNVPFEQVWGLLVDGSFHPGMPPAEPHPLSARSSDPRVDVQAALAMLAPSGVSGG